MPKYYSYLIEKKPIVNISSPLFIKQIKELINFLVLKVINLKVSEGLLKLL